MNIVLHNVYPGTLKAHPSTTIQYETLPNLLAPLSTYIGLYILLLLHTKYYIGLQVQFPKIVFIYSYKVQDEVITFVIRVWF